MQIIKAVPGVPFSIGRQGENQARQVQIDLTPWVGLYGQGIAELIYQRPGETTSYPVAIERQGNLVLWTVTDTDTALASAPQDRVYGRAELRYYVDDTLVKSEISAVSVYASMEIPGEVPAPPGQNWLDQALAAGVDAKRFADQAEEATRHAPYIGTNGNWFVWNADELAYEDTGCFSGGEAPYIGANGNWFIAGEDSGVSASGPKGEKGDKGDTGATGATGPAGAKGEKGDKGDKGEPGTVGPQGPKGDTGAKGEKGDTGATGATGPKGDIGATGPAGADGKTPVKGTDYWTQADQTSIVNDVLAALPIWTGGAY